MKKLRNVILSIAVVLAAGLGIAAWKGIIPPRSGVEGAIGAAQRYSSPQIGDSDVSLRDPEVQAFLQSDLFHKIATNADFRAVVAKGDFARAAHNQDMLKVASSADFAWACL